MPNQEKYLFLPPSPEVHTHFMDGTKGAVLVPNMIKTKTSAPKNKTLKINAPIRGSAVP